MIVWRWILYGLSVYAVLTGLWDHSLRLILVGVVVAVIYPLIAAPIEHVAVCRGCTRGRIVPGCPVHDPEQRKAAA